MFIQDPVFQRCVRTTDPEWEKAQEGASKLGRDLGLPVSRSAYIRRALRRQLEEDGIDLESDE